MDPKKICVMGLGGAGGKVIDRLGGTVKGGPSLVAVNTDARELSASTAPAKLQIGAAATNGSGTGGDAELGAQAAEDDRKIIDSVVSGMDLVFLVAGFGGGTGGGAAPSILNAAREAGALTLCFAALPFPFEGAARLVEAERAVAAARPCADGLILVPNERLAKSVGKGKVQEAFLKADEVMAAGIRGLWKLLTQAGYIRLDFANLRKVVQDSGGICTFACGEGRGKNTAQAAVTALLGSPLLEQGELLATARSALVSIAGGPDLTLQEVGDVMDGISAKAGPDCVLTMGTVIDEAWRSRIGIVAVVSEERHFEQAPVPAKRTDPAPGKPSAGSGRRPAKPRQTKLGLDTSGKGRFKDVEPTILDGEDLDIPTFRRRGISVE